MYQTAADNAPPVFENITQDITIIVEPGETQAMVTWTTPVATDASGEVTLTSDYNPGDMFPVGTTTVTYMAVDFTGNTATQTFIVSVVGEYMLQMIGVLLLFSALVANPYTFMIISLILHLRRCDVFVLKLMDFRLNKF